MKEKQIIPVILCGGNGTRLWPLSREQYPKQFLSLQGNVSMLQATISRLANLKCSEPIVVCNDKHRFIVAEQLKKKKSVNYRIILYWSLKVRILRQQLHCLRLSLRKLQIYHQLYC